MSKRFNRETLFQQLRYMGDRIKEAYDFTDMSGTNQLKRTGITRDELIDLAVAYGRWQTMKDIAEKVKYDKLGTPKEDEQ